MKMGSRALLWLSFGLLAEACASDETACGGPTSDFPYCEDQRPTDDQGGEQAPGNTGGNSAEPPSSADGGAVQCEAPLPMCEGASTPLSIKGEAPDGMVTLESVALVYNEARSATELHFGGKLAADALAIEVSLPAAANTSAVTSVGVYTTGETSAPLSANANVCGTMFPIAVSVTITSHDAVSVDAAAGNLRGMLEVREPNWTLAVPFEIDQACRRTTP